MAAVIDNNNQTTSITAAAWAEIVPAPLADSSRRTVGLISIENSGSSAARTTCLVSVYDGTTDNVFYTPVLPGTQTASPGSISDPDIGTPGVMLFRPNIVLVPGQSIRLKPLVAPTTALHVYAGFTDSSI